MTVNATKQRERTTQTRAKQMEEKLTLKKDSEEPNRQKDQKSENFEKKKTTKLMKIDKKYNRTAIVFSVMTKSKIISKGLYCN